MTVDLPDVNVWVALCDSFHIHHRRTQQFWDHERSKQIAFCGVTVGGMLRILTLPTAMAGNPFTPPQAVRKYQSFAALPEVSFLADSPDLGIRLAAWAQHPFFTPKLWTDAWIAAIAMEHGCRVVSFDSDFAKFPGLNFLHLTP